MNDYNDGVAHNSGDVCYCGNSECKNYVATMLNEREQLRNEREQHVKTLDLLQRRVDSLAQQVEQAREWLIEQKDEMSGEEFVAVYEDLANILDVNLEEEVTVEVVMTQTLVVKVPLGHELTEQDFWANGRSEIIDCNYTIEREEGDIEIEDIRMNNRY